jgi:hypothetical protein
VADKAEKPKHDQDDNYSPEHVFLSIELALLRHNVVIRSSKKL